MYIRYIYKLRELHLQCDNHTEAGFTLLLHADLLDWTEQTLHNDVEYPREQEWRRKERLYRQIIEHFDKGQVSREALNWSIVHIVTSLLLITQTVDFQRPPRIKSRLGVRSRNLNGITQLL